MGSDSISLMAKPTLFSLNMLSPAYELDEDLPEEEFEFEAEGEDESELLEELRRLLSCSSSALFSSCSSSLMAAYCSRCYMISISLAVAFGLHFILDSF